MPKPGEVHGILLSAHCCARATTCGVPYSAMVIAPASFSRWNASTAGGTLYSIVDVDQLDVVAVDAALAVDQVDIVVHADAQVGADDLGGAGAVALQA